MFKGIGNLLSDMINNSVGTNGPIGRTVKGRPPLPPEYVYWVTKDRVYLGTQDGDEIIFDVIYN